MNVKPCYGCALRFTGEVSFGRGGVPKPTRCPVLVEKLSHITKGAEFTSIDFKCPTRDSIFTPGEAVRFELFSREYDSTDDYTGYVWKMRGPKVVVLSSETEKPMLAFYTSRLSRLTSEPPKRCCIHCGKPEGLLENVWKGKPLNGGPPSVEPYVCRTDYDQDSREIALPCEYKEESPNDAA